LTENSTGKLQEALNLLEEGLVKKAIEVLRGLVEERPDLIESWYNLGYALTEAEEYEEAVKAYDEALAIDNFIFEIWFNKGAALYAMSDFEAARDCYEEALEINPDDAEAWNNIGNCHSRLTNGEAAIEAYTRAVALKPDYAEAFYNKANAHFIEEQDEKAITYAELAVELNPELSKMVSQWINVSRNRLASRKEDAEHKRRQLEKSGSEEI
jgi:tetratricopeptide (TPR) repeat protein